MDKKTLEKLKKKDQQAFEKVYHETKNAVFAIIISITKNQDDAEDLMQDTYIKMLESINSYNPKKSFKTWIMTIAKNLAIDHYRRQRKTYTVDMLEEEQVFFKADSYNPDSDIIALELLDTLTDDERIIVLLRVVDELTFKEISEVVDRPLGTVLWSYNNSMKKLEKEYNKKVGV